MCIVELRVTVNNIKLLSVAQKCFYVEFVFPVTIKLIHVKCPTFCPILTKFGVSRQIVTEAQISNFTEIVQ
jgi:hypothetical protein